MIQVQHKMMLQENVAVIVVLTCLLVENQVLIYNRKLELSFCG